MQRVALHGYSVRAIVVLFAASALLSAGFGGSGHGTDTGKAVAYLCPPVC